MMQLSGYGDRVFADNPFPMPYCADYDLTTMGLIPKGGSGTRVPLRIGP